MNRPDLLSASKGTLSRLERFHIRAVRRTFEPGGIDRAVRWLQRNVGARWICFATSRLTNYHHVDRLPALDPEKSYIFVCNHRSFFDMFPLFSELNRRKLLHHRIFFPVRSGFFYDRFLGFLINGAAAFFAMYPPVFRERKQVAMNLVGLEEIVWMLQQGGFALGIHPEGTRNKGNPYELLPFKAGLGRIVYGAGERAVVIPVFTNGLETDSFSKQMSGAVRGTGTPIHTLFGDPVPLQDLLSQAASTHVLQQIITRTRDAVLQLAQEERALRFGDVSPTQLSLPASAPGSSS